GVNHAGHQDAARGVNLHCAVGDGQLPAHSGDALVDDEDIAASYHPQGRIHGEDGGVAKDYRTARGEVIGVRGRGLAHLAHAAHLVVPGAQDAKRWQCLTLPDLQRRLGGRWPGCSASVLFAKLPIHIETESRVVRVADTRPLECYTTAQAVSRGDRWA